MNLYGYANGDPVNYSDPFGLYADRQDEGASECCEEGGTVAVAVSGGAALSTVGANFELGIVFSLSNGTFSLFAGAGNSIGAGASFGLEVTAQRGSIADFLGGSDMNSNASELEISGGLLGGNIVFAPDKSGIVGAGFNVGPGIGGLWNLRAGTVATKPASLRERWAALPPIRISPHH
jgi:hypothetical protein